MIYGYNKIKFKTKNKKMENFPEKLKIEKQKNSLQQENSIEKDLIKEEYAWLRELLKGEDYKKFVKQKLEESEMDNENLEFANSSLEDADQITKDFENLLNQKIKELKLAKIDTTTKLKNRPYFFLETIPKELSKVLGREVKNISDKEWLELLSKEGDELEKVHLTMAMADLSYLSLANREGHHSGDNLLKNLGETVSGDNETKKNAHRYGGDEFSFLFKNPDEALEKTEALREDFSSLKEISSLEKYGLKPNLDIGTAAFSEAVMLFRKLLELKESKEHIEKDKVFKEFNTIWTMLADKRSFINKAKQRILLLTEKYQAGHDLEGEIINEEKAKEYDFLMKYLGKGAFEIEKKEIAELIKEAGDNSQKMENLIWDYIKDKEAKKLSGEREYEALRDQAIAIMTGIIDEYKI